MSSKSTVSRRNVLETVTGSLVALGATGFASAAPDETVRVNVGYGAESGRQAALVAAQEVVHDFTFDALTVRGEKQSLTGLADRRDVRYVEVDGTYRALDQTLPWGVDRVDADVAYSNGETGGDDTDGEGGADVAIIDTGIDDDHPDVDENLADLSVDTNHKAWVGCAGTNCNYPWSDDNDHGTHCAGITAAVDNGRGVVGVGPEVRLHALKVLDATGIGSWSDVAAAIDHTTKHGWDVASMSLGGGESSVVKEACETAYKNGVLLVAAAGNAGPCTDCVSHPAAYPEVVAVSATNENDGFASFSSQGPEVELAAPGDDICSTVIGDYGTKSGTSMACPHVSGAGAQLMDNGYTNDEARQHLKDTAENLGLSDNRQGSGLVDIAAALGLDSSDDGTGSGDCPSGLL